MRKKWELGLAVGFGLTLLVVGGSVNGEPRNKSAENLISAEDAVNLAQLVSSSADGKALAAGVANSSIDFILPTLGEKLPEYLKGLEIEVNFREDLKPEYAILTVQPLWQSEGKDRTVFTQLSQRRYSYLGTDRDVTNAGLGYRQAFLENSIMAGVNGFFDYEWKRGHKRAGVGAEVKWSGLDLTANTYYAISNKSGRGLDGDAVEEVLDGHDIELSAQLPYLPWAKVHARRYYWDSVANSEDVKGWSASLEADLQQNLKIEGGWNKDNFMAERESFVKLAFHIPFGAPRPVAMSSKFISDSAWEKRDMRDHMLDKVRRENKIIVERTSSGVVITRGN